MCATPRADPTEGFCTSVVRLIGVRANGSVVETDIREENVADFLNANANVLDNWQ
jgi:hypothetical protein